MSNIGDILGQGAVELEFDTAFYPMDAVYGAAYIFIERCYLHLDRIAEQRVKVALKAKLPGASSEALAGDFQNEILGQAWRRQIVEENRPLIETITSTALAGAAGPPGLDDLLEMEIGEETAFEDPLGIAMSWEEKYARKKGGAQADDAVGAGKAT
jgi:His-Xaa-Ser system protein HxsD